jgi:exodeoxyribonuclease V
MTASPIPHVSTNCAGCGRDLHDLTDAQTGLDKECRGMYGYRKISALNDHQRAEANAIIHKLSQDTLRTEELRAAIFRIHELGFAELARRIERRVWRDGIEAAPTPAAPVEVPSKPSLNLPFTLTQGQDRGLEAVRKIMHVGGHACVVIVGFAGTGKTTMIKVIAHEHGTPMVITPTGKASLRVREATGLPARTIHSWLYNAIPDEKTGAVRFMRRSSDDLEIPPSRLVVLDEGSMVGPDVWKDVYSACEQNDLRLVCIGDGFQLPPVQAPSAPPFSILTPEFAGELGATRVEMTEVLRQAQDSPVIRASMMLRAGHGVSALADLPQIQLNNFGMAALDVHRMGGITICHRNVTRFQLNSMFRQSLGIFDEMPQPGEPLMVLKNAYELGLVNGESFTFTGWAKEPTQPEKIRDRYKPGLEEHARFGGVTVPSGACGTIAIEELHGRLGSGPVAISIAGNVWSRMESFFSGDKLASHINANFGYVYTAHKSQGSEWPWVLVVVEPSVRLDEEDGRRWTYTAITRSSKMTAVYLGRI